MPSASPAFGQRARGPRRGTEADAPSARRGDRRRGRGGAAVRHRAASCVQLASPLGGHRRRAGGRCLPGAELNPAAQSRAAHAITIAAPPRAWPWLAQVGLGKAALQRPARQHRPPGAEQIIEGAPSIRHVSETTVPMLRSSPVNDVTAPRITPWTPLAISSEQARQHPGLTLTPAAASTRRDAPAHPLRARQRPPALCAPACSTSSADSPMMRKMLRTLRGRAERGRAEAALVRTYPFPAPCPGSPRLVEAATLKAAAGESVAGSNPAGHAPM